MARRKFHDTPETVDVLLTLHQLVSDAHAQVTVTLRPSMQNPTSLIVRVEFRAPSVDMAADPVHTYQEAVDTRRRIDLASVLHRILSEAWASYHGTPWAWTGGMRRAHVRSEA